MKKKQKGVKLFFDPVQTFLDAANEAFPVGNYPGFRAEVQYAPILTPGGNLKRAKGMLEMAIRPVNQPPSIERDGVSLITINLNVHAGMVVEVIAHELAHLLSWPNKDHGREWGRNLSLLFDAYKRRLDGMRPAERSGMVEVSFFKGKIRARAVGGKVIKTRGKRGGKPE